MIARPMTLHPFSDSDIVALESRIVGANELVQLAGREEAGHAMGMFSTAGFAVLIHEPVVVY